LRCSNALCGASKPPISIACEKSSLRVIAKLSTLLSNTHTHGHLPPPLKKTGSLCCEFNPKVPKRLQLATKFFRSMELLAAELSFFKVS
jgi:hypothetical protein